MFDLDILGFISEKRTFYSDTINKSGIIELIFD